MQLGADDYLLKPFTRAELLGAIATRLAKQAAVMQQYNTEHQRAEALKQKVQELQQYADSKDELLNQFQQDLSNVVPKLNMAIQMLQKVQSGTQRDRCLKILQEACTDEIALLNQMPGLQNLLTAENLKLLHQYNIVSSGTEK